MLYALRSTQQRMAFRQLNRLQILYIISWSRITGLDGVLELRSFIGRFGTLLVEAVHIDAVIAEHIGWREGTDMCSGSLTTN